MKRGNGLLSPAPKAQYSREQRQQFKSGAAPDPRRGRGNFTHDQRVAFNNGSQPDPRAPKMSAPVQAGQVMGQALGNQRPPMPQQQAPQQQFQTPPNFQPGQFPQLPQGWGQGLGNLFGGQQGYKPMLPDPGFNGGGQFQMGAGFPGGPPMPQGQQQSWMGFNPKFRGY